MLNWKTTIGLTLLLLSSVEFLIIRDHYHPHRSLRIDQLFSITGFIITIFIAAVLVITGMRRSSRG